MINATAFVVTLLAVSREQPIYGSVTIGSDVSAVEYHLSSGGTAKLACEKNRCKFEVRAGSKVFRMSPKQLSAIGVKRADTFHIWSAPDHFSINYFWASLPKPCNVYTSKKLCFVSFGIANGKLISKYEDAEMDISTLKSPTPP